jgi:hypothetical protein
MANTPQSAVFCRSGVMLWHFGHNITCDRSGLARATALNFTIQQKPIRSLTPKPTRHTSFSTLLISFPIRLISVALDKILRYRLSAAIHPPANPHDVAKARWTNPRVLALAKSSTTTTLNAKATYRHTTEARSSM